MRKTILITGATDGIGLATAKLLVSLGHNVLLHGRDPAKLDGIKKQLLVQSGGASIETYVADLSRMVDVEALATAILQTHTHLDVLINNAGVFSAPSTLTVDGLDLRFAVNTLAPYLLTQQLLPLFEADSRVINLSSAAQSPVSLQALAGLEKITEDFTAYAQSKLALTMWSFSMAKSLGKNGPIVIAVNPGSMLGSKMVKNAFGVEGGDLSKGAKILTRAALDTEFSEASGRYFDNDSGQFSEPHPEGLDQQKCAELVDRIETVLADLQ